MKKRFLTTIFVLICCLGLILPAQASAADAFRDVPASYWGYNNIQRAYNDGVVTGSAYDPTTGVKYYLPESNLTIAEFVTILARAFYAEDMNNSTATGQWYAVAQDIANKHNLTNGLNNINYGATASRYQMAVIMQNVMTNLGSTTPSSSELTVAQSNIGDYDSVPSQYKDAVATVFAAGLITGKDANGNFMGNNGVTRAEAATVYCRLADYIDEKPNPSAEVSTMPAAEINAEPSSMQIENNQTGSVKLTVHNIPSYTVEWKSSNTNILLPIRNNGAFKTIAPGSAKFTCTVTDKISGKTYTATCNVTVIEASYDIPKQSPNTEPQPTNDSLNQQSTIEKEQNTEVITTLANGKEINDDNILEILNEVKNNYPNDMPWTNDNIYTSETLRIRGLGCEGFALICSDAVFGTLPISNIHSNFDEIKVGDLIRMDNNTHTVLVIEKKASSVIVAEGNFNNAIKWGREISKQTLENGNFVVRSRYPENK